MSDFPASLVMDCEGNTLPNDFYYGSKSETTRFSPRERGILHFQQSLGAMLEDWTPAELKAGRRRVQFFIEGARDGRRTVVCRVIPASDLISPADMASVVSCIALPNGGHFITWHDLSHLTQILYGYDLTTPERNRLRRHLERFRPRMIGKEQGLHEHIYSYTEPSATAGARSGSKIYPWTRGRHSIPVCDGQAYALSGAYRHLMSSIHVSAPVPSLYHS
jgi:hypothetical protein